MRATIRASFLFIVLLIVIGAACAGSSGEGGSVDDVATTSAAAASEARDAGAPPEDAGTPAAPDAIRKTLGDGALPVAVQVGVAGRNIIFEADLTVAVDDVSAASREAITVVTGLGGFLFAQQTTGAPEATSTLTFKVQPEDFQNILQQLGSIGDVRNQVITADDVTERIVDLESRITTAQASVERLRAFLEKADDVATVSELETQLLLRETDLETMRGQLRTIENRVDLATIVVRLTEALSRPEMAVEVTAYPGADGGVSCPGSSGVSVDEGETVTVCWEITNTGDTPLADFEINDNVLGIGLSDLLVVFGDPNGVLQTGQSLVLASEVALSRDLRTQTRVAAVPVDQDGNRLEGREVSSTRGIFLNAVDPGGLPGFRDSFDASVDALQSLVGIVILAAGAAVPFFWVPIVGWMFLRWRDKDRATDPRVKTTPGGSETIAGSGAENGTPTDVDNEPGTVSVESAEE
ncbi:hypothetical protein BMS3Bbin02_00125 [bacterium BMS3Bbin02]|nr:hypothetical protein BMS3Bbin02_00125 [bacterium BMS3Bbin02]